jgi:hypothetical protein
MPANFERVHALVESGRAVGKIVLSGFRASTRRCNCLRGVAVGVGGELYRIGRPQAGNGAHCSGPLHTQGNREQSSVIPPQWRNVRGPPWRRTSRRWIEYPVTALRRATVCRKCR